MPPLFKYLKSGIFTIYTQTVMLGNILCTTNIFLYWFLIQFREKRSFSSKEKYSAVLFLFFFFFNQWAEIVHLNFKNHKKNFFSFGSQETLETKGNKGTEKVHKDPDWRKKAIPNKAVKVNKREYLCRQFLWNKCYLPPNSLIWKWDMPFVKYTHSQREKRKELYSKEGKNCAQMIPSH